MRITSKLKRIILKEARKSSHLGVRALARLLQEQYKLAVSKSAINNLLRKHHSLTARGRKSSRLLYTHKGSEHKALLLLSCVDKNIGLCQSLACELKPYLPHLKTDAIEKLLRLISFSSYAGGSFNQNMRKTGHLRMAGFYALPVRSLEYLLKRVTEHKPSLDLKKVSANLVLVSSVRFRFANGYSGYCDGRFSTLWEDLCRIGYFSSPLCCARNRILNLLKEKICLIYYTKSFDYLSTSVIKFIEGLSSGIRKIELLGPKGEVLEAFECNLAKTSFLLGYYPKILNKGISFLEKPHRFKKITGFEGDIFYSAIAVRCTTADNKTELLLNNVFLKRKEKSLPVWGVFTDKKENIERALKKYIDMWPYLDEVFVEEMKAVERFYSQEERPDELLRPLPKDISFENPEDFAQITEILAGIFKELSGSTSVPSAYGLLRRTEDSYRLRVPGLSQEARRKFNSWCFYLDGRRIFVA